VTVPCLDLKLSFVSTVNGPYQVAEKVEWSSVAELSSSRISHERCCLVRVAEVAARQYAVEKHFAQQVHNEIALPNTVATCSYLLHCSVAWFAKDWSMAEGKLYFLAELVSEGPLGKNDLRQYPRQKLKIASGTACDLRGLELLLSCN